MELDADFQLLEGAQLAVKNPFTPRRKDSRRGRRRTARGFLAQHANLRKRTILDPRILPEIGYGHNKRPIRMSDYISVPAIETYGVWKALDLIEPTQLAALKAFTNSLPKG